MLHQNPKVTDTHLPRIWIQSHYGSFNGLRALAVLAVFASHYGYFWGFQRPQFFLWAGVDLFFVLSGFLITGILYDSLQNPRFFRNFYTRRALRIFPLFYAVFLLLLVLTPLLHLVYSPGIWTYALYVGNLVSPFAIRAQTDIAAIYTYQHGVLTIVSYLGHLWSLCVEEQFYLLWPAVIWYVRERRRLMRLCVIVSILVLLLRVFLHEHYNLFYLIYSATYTRCDTLLVGAWMSLWLRGQALSLVQLRRISFFLFWPSAITVVVMILRLPRIDPILVHHSRFVTTIGFTLIALACAGLILRSLDDSSRLSALLRSKPLHALGTISYGFYILHVLPLNLLTTSSAHHPYWAMATPVVAFTLTVAAATLSFRYLETPFLRLKSSLAPQRPEPQSDGWFIPAHLHVSEPHA